MKLRLTQETLKRLKRFRKNKRAFWSLIVLVIAYLLSLTSPWTVNDEPLYLRYEGKSYFPAFVRYSEKDFGGEYQTEQDYAKLFAAVQECEEDAAEGTADEDDANADGNYANHPDVLPWRELLLLEWENAVLGNGKSCAEYACIVR